MKIFVDIDETICRYDGREIGDSHRYPHAIPIKENIEKINKLYDEGNIITYWTARGSTSGISWYQLTAKQLEEWGAKFHELRLGKPDYALFICDKTKRIEEI